jgi:pumilio family protein 6
MAPRNSAPAAPVKRKASSTDTKRSDGSRAKKPKTVAAPKRQKVDDDEGVASDSDGSGLSDSGDGGAELKESQPARLASRPKENARPAEGLLFLLPV